MKVDYNSVKEAVDSLSIKTHCFPGTTTTIAVAFLPDGFSVGFGKSGCVDPAEHDPQVGIDVAVANCKRDAENNIWQLKGWDLRNHMLAKTAEVHFP